jgi:predicted TIM-barrel fold metal-dependent hydrolase
MSLVHPIVDLRNRPSFLHKFFGSTPNTAEFEVVRWVNRRVGSRDIDHFARSTDLPAYLAEIAAAGIATGVMVGRSTPTVRISNDRLSDLAAQSGGRLIGIASVDLLQLGAAGALAEAKRAVLELGLKGVNFDAGFYETALAHDDERLLPLYQACQDLGVPAFVMSGPTTPDLRFNDPLAIDRVAGLFPKLPIVCCHGFYPNVAAMVAVAFRHENVYVSPDMYMFSPGGGLYIEAANGFMREQFLFGTSYPFRPMKQSVDDFRAIGLSAESLKAASYGNASRLLKLDVKAG